MLEEKIFASGKVIYNNFHIISDKSIEDQCEYLLEDLIQVEYDDSLLLDIGWYPECDPKGDFTIYLIREFDWDKPLEKINVRNIEEIINAVEMLKTEYCLK